MGTNISELSSSEQAQARNVTKSIFVVQQGDVSVTVDLVENDSAVPEGEDGGAINAVSSFVLLLYLWHTNDLDLELGRRRADHYPALQHDITGRL